MDSNFVKARSSIVWLLAIACAFGAVWWIERQTGRELIARQATPAPGQRAPTGADPLQPSPGIPAEPATRPLTAQEKQWARVAWAYFENNTDPQTGLVHAVDGFPSATLWDTASYLLALIAARDLELIEKRSFDIRMAKALVSLERMPLQDGKLPNKSYNTATLAMTDYANQPAPAGIGWSAIDIGRLLVPLNVIAWHHGVHTEAARRVIARWDTSRLARDGELFGLQADRREVQEGRLGYEQYAARSFALMGLDVDAAADWRRHLRLVTVAEVTVCADDRDPQQFGAQNFVVSEPYVLAGLEFGWTRAARECAWRAYRAQEARFAKTGIATAVSEDHVDQAPFFVYNSIWTAGKPWATVTDKGEDATALRSLSTKAAFGWHALLRTEYTGQLVARVATLNDPARGWYAGLYEEGAKPNKALCANTNAVVLESLAYIARGRSLNYR